MSGRNFGLWIDVDDVDKVEQSLHPLTLLVVSRPMILGLTLILMKESASMSQFKFSLLHIVEIVSNGELPM